MAEENEGRSPEENAPEGKRTAEDIFEEVSQQSAVREVEMPGAVTEKDKTKATISQAMEESSDLTDLQSALAKLFPEKIDLNAVMIGRIAPDVFLALWQILSTDEVMRADPEKAIDVNEIRARNYVRLSIGLDGKGRIDIAELLGAVREEKKAEKLLGKGGM